MDPDSTLHVVCKHVILLNANRKNKNDQAHGRDRIIQGLLLLLFSSY